MTIEDVLKYYGNIYQFSKKTGISPSNVYNWKKYGYVPLSMQCRIQILTNNELKADDVHPYKEGK